MINVDLLYPVGSIYLSIKSKNPSEIFGGTWERIAKGKTLVGVDENDTDFNASSKTGGEKTHKLTIEELPINSFKANGSSGDWTYLGVSSIKPHNNMQPYYTCYIFVRTA